MTLSSNQRNRNVESVADTGFFSFGIVAGKVKSRVFRSWRSEC